jgi:hypothetical protein
MQSLAMAIAPGFASAFKTLENDITRHFLPYLRLQRLPALTAAIPSNMIAPTDDDDDNGGSDASSSASACSSGIPTRPDMDDGSPRPAANLMALFSPDGPDSPIVCDDRSPAKGFDPNPQPNGAGVETSPAEGPNLHFGWIEGSPAKGPDPVTASIPESSSAALAGRRNPDEDNAGSRSQMRRFTDGTQGTSHAQASGEGVQEVAGVDRSRTGRQTLQRNPRSEQASTSGLHPAGNAPLDDGAASTGNMDGSEEACEKAQPRAQRTGQATVTAQDPLWLTFKDNALEKQFAEERAAAHTTVRPLGVACCEDRGAGMWEWRGTYASKGKRHMKTYLGLQQPYFTLCPGLLSVPEVQSI